MGVKILIILACVPLYVLNAFCDKYASSKYGNKSSNLYNSIKFLIGSILLLPLVFVDKAPKFGLGTVVCGIVCGIMYAINKTITMKGYEKTSIAFMTLCNASGMIIPCVIGHYFWSEKLTVLSALGIILAVIAIVLLKENKASKKKFAFVGIVIGVVVFVSSGGKMILQKIIGLYCAGQSISAYNLYSFVVSFLLVGCFAKPDRQSKTDMKSILPCAALSAVSLTAISFVMTKLAGSVPSVILFPLFNGLGILCVCIGSIFVFKEKLTVPKAIGLGLGVLGLCLVSL